MDRAFGLILIHSHFDLDENERLVEYNGTSVPWQLSKISGNIRASNWLVSVGGAITPYEFYYASAGDDAVEPDLSNADQHAFLVEFKDHRRYGMQSSIAAADTRPRVTLVNTEVAERAPN
jgi:hypothetical protein